MSDYAPEILARLQRTEFAIAKAFFSFCQEHGIDYHIKEKTITEE